MNRQDCVARAKQPDQQFDLIIVGGGATGIGMAVDAASRGYSVCLVEQSDFGKGTSSRSTKLVHGGVRYLQQGNISLVMEALKERGLLRQNAPHLVHDLGFVVPNYDWWETPFYGIGMKVYDLLAGKFGFGKSRTLSKEETLERIPTLEAEGLRGGVLYYDGQFDDARLIVNLAQTAVQHGACLINYCRCVSLLKDDEGFVSGIVAHDEEARADLEIAGRVVVNATGCFTDGLRRMDDPKAAAIIAPSQGVHLVLPKEFLAGDTAIMVPRTSDGRVLFAIPWHGVTVVGTTDTAIDEVSLEPTALEEEIVFILETAAQYLDQNPTREDVLSVFVGIRPLVKMGDTNTAALSREHTIDISKSGLMTIAGGKWTTYRKMAEDGVDHAIMLGKLEDSDCVTKNLAIHGSPGPDVTVDKALPLWAYGSDAAAIQALAADNTELATPIHPRLDVTGAEVVWAVRHEMARTVDDFLARRSRSLLLDARSAHEAAPRVAALMAAELKQDAAWQQTQITTFQGIADGYVL